MAKKPNAQRKAKRKQGLKDIGSGIKDALTGFGKNALLSTGIIAKSAADLGSMNPVGAVQTIAENYKPAAKSVGQMWKGIGRTVKGIGKAIFNHPEWYTNYPLDNLVNANYGIRNSISNNISTLLEMGVGSQATKTNTIARYDIALTIPKDDVNSFAQAVSILYAKIRSANAGSINYSVEDLSAYILNVRSIRVALNQIRRMLESTYVTDPYNANIPILLTNAASGYQVSGANRIGCDFETVSSNAAALHNKLIIWYKLVGSLLPINLNLLDRADWLFSNIFRDSMGAKPSVFIPYAGSVPHYTASGASLSKADVKLQNTSTSFADNFKAMISNVDKFIQTITTLNANVIIAGDILKAFGDNAFFNQNMDPLGTPANIIYDEAALTQFQNASVLGAAQDKYTSETYNFETGAHTLTLTIPTTYYGMSRYAPKNVLINTYKDSMSPAETISYSRFSVVNTYTNGVITIETCGSEIMKDIIYYTTQETNGLFTTYAWSSMVLGTTSTAMYIINAWAYLDYSPMLFMLLSENENTLMFDFNKYAVCTKAELSTYHQYATLSLLASQAHVKRQNEFNFIQ